MKQKTNGGYVGTLVLVLSLSIFIFLYAKFYFLPGSNRSTSEKEVVETANQALGTPVTSNTAPDTRIGQLRQNVDTAKSVQGVLNNQAGETNQMLDEI